MKVRDAYIRKYRWQVRIYYAVTCYHSSQILDYLCELNCPENIYSRAEKHLLRGDLNTGFTFSNKRIRGSVMVVGLSSSPSEFLNSFEHEVRHLVDDIADAYDISHNGEEVAYLVGDINSLLWDDVHDFVCCTHKCKCYE